MNGYVVALGSLVEDFLHLKSFHKHLTLEDFC
jgi:hypothetical protein